MTESKIIKIGNFEYKIMNGFINRSFKHSLRPLGMSDKEIKILAEEGKIRLLNWEDQVPYMSICKKTGKIYFGKNQNWGRNSCKLLVRI